MTEVNSTFAGYAIYIWDSTLVMSEALLECLYVASITASIEDCALTARMPSNALPMVLNIDTSGTETVLRSFTGSDGAKPNAGLVQDAEGNFYGTTSYGGPANLGTVSKINTSGEETALHAFTGSDGSIPLAGLVLDGDGNLYGTTYYGGMARQGTIFKLSF